MKYLLTLVVVFATTTSNAQYAESDPTAIGILDRMSEVIGDLYACSFTLTIIHDVVHRNGSADDGHSLVTSHNTSRIFMSGFDKLLIDSNGDKGHRGIWYDGAQLAWYSYDENNFVVVDAPDGTVETMYTLHEKYEIDFPAADFFNPYLTDDLLETMNSIEYIGRSWIDDTKVYHIMAENDEMRVEFWITDDSILLPKKMRISYLTKEGMPRYEAELSDWKVNPDLPNAMFKFSPPPGARQIAIAVSTDEE